MGFQPVLIWKRAGSPPHKIGEFISWKSLSAEFASSSGILLKKLSVPLRFPLRPTLREGVRGACRLRLSAYCV
jgi:hypothetical protein